MEVTARIQTDKFFFNNGRVEQERLDFFSNNGRVKQEQLADRNCNMHAGASHPSSIQHALWPKALSLLLRTGPLSPVFPSALIFECFVSACADFSPASEDAQDR